MCTLSIIVALLMFTGIYHLFAGPYPSALQVAHTIPRMTIPIHQRLPSLQPLIVQDPFNTSNWIAIQQVAQGEIYEKQPILKRYFWRNMYIRYCKTCTTKK